MKAMMNTMLGGWLVALLGTVCTIVTAPALAGAFFFSAGNPDGRLATGSRPASLTGGNPEIESADDFILGSNTRISHATFTGLITSGSALSDINQVSVEIYRVFPKDSNTVRTPNVPTRVNSPSDVTFDSRDSGTATLNFTTSTLNASFTASNSVLNGINPLPNPTTGGEGPVTGQEVQFDITFATPFDLPADHYFFVPQVDLLGTGNFLWLSAPKPIVAPGTPIVPDLQTWIRNDNLAPDWLRVGTDIIGSNTFNAAFSLDGQTVPEPGTLALLIIGALAFLRRRTIEALYP